MSQSERASQPLLDCIRFEPGLAAASMDPELVAAAQDQGLTVAELLPEGVELEKPPTTGLMVVGVTLLFQTLIYRPPRCGARPGSRTRPRSCSRTRSGGG